jgi:hypothetical protein
MSGKFWHVNVVTFRLELRLRHEYSCWKVVSEKNAYKESDYELVHFVINNFMRRINYKLIDEMFYAMHVLTVIITCTFLAELEV